MDRTKAAELEGRLRGKNIGVWTIEALIDHGKSAAVFRASGPDGRVAVKVFDDELIARYGDDTQFARIERELELVGCHHPNLVKIFDGGVDPVTMNHFLVMEYLDGPSLRKCLAEVPAESVPSLICQLSSAAEFLEGLGYVHRDIKPDNIVLLDGFTKLVLLDFGVIRPIAGSNLTDEDGVQAFVGTLQYSSPEFLLREEEHSPAGWRALTFYQIGATLHDLIMRRPLFADFVHPYARLVNAVQRITPEIQSATTPHYLVEVARCCLLKNWKVRLKLVEWASFKEPPTINEARDSAKRRVTNRGALARARLEEVVEAEPQQDQVALKKLYLDTLDLLTMAARTIRAENAALPPLRMLPKTPDENSFGIRFGRAPVFGLARDLTILITVEVVDVAVRIVSIRACGCVGAFVRGDTIDAACTQIYQGTYDTSAMFAALERCIYDLIDRAQQEPEASSDVSQTLWFVPRSS